MQRKRELVLLDLSLGKQQPSKQDVNSKSGPRQRQQQQKHQETRKQQEAVTSAVSNAKISTGGAAIAATAIAGNDTDDDSAAQQESDKAYHNMVDLLVSEDNKKDTEVQGHSNSATNLLKKSIWSNNNGTPGATNTTNANGANGSNVPSTQNNVGVNINNQF
ncbi:unnamed protein product [Ambrosiozyma monospora]|uniref:Unnamed protein product n=1 Tax=Ambrosiozyma monospora TaxID=43982 RepID=A0ACB5UA54_AMBMO|nr:unnamed protein product [Ambrosiozyma monospora]